jgi:hypothetical protein
MNEFSVPVGLPVLCFKEGSLILTLHQDYGIEEYQPVESLTTETLVKVYSPGDKGGDHYRKIKMIGYNVLRNPSDDERTKNRMYRLSTQQYPDLFQDLYLTGGHAVLVDELTKKQREMIVERFDRIFVTEDKYRLMTCVDERAIPWKKDVEVCIYHFALEDADPRRNFGVYANGLLVESAFQHDFIKRNNLLKTLP